MKRFVSLVLFLGLLGSGTAAAQSAQWPCLVHYWRARDGKGGHGVISYSLGRESFGYAPGEVWGFTTDWKWARTRGDGNEKRYGSHLRKAQNASLGPHYIKMKMSDKPWDALPFWVTLGPGETKNFYHNLMELRCEKGADPNVCDWGLIDRVKGEWKVHFEYRVQWNCGGKDDARVLADCAWWHLYNNADFKNKLTGQGFPQNSKASNCLKDKVAEISKAKINEHLKKPARWDTPKKDHCVGSGVRQWSAILRDIPGSWEAACASTATTVAGKYFSRPTRCKNTGITGMWGEFDVADSSCIEKCGRKIKVDDVAGKFRHNVHHACQAKEVAEDTNKTIECAWKVTLEEFKEKGFDPTAECKSEVVKQSMWKVNEHVTFWRKNPGAPRLGGLVKGVEKVAAVTMDVVCATIGAPICMVVQLIQTFGGFVERLGTYKGDLGKTLHSYWAEFKKKVDDFGKTSAERIKNLFESFRQFLTLKHEKDFVDKALKFAGDVFNTVTEVTKGFIDVIGLPPFLGTVLGWINGGVITVTVAPAVTGLAAVNLGARKLFEWIIPEMVLGVGALGSTPNLGLLSGILDKFKEFAGIAGGAAGGLIGILVKDPKKKERIKAVLEKIGDVAGKVEKGLGGVLDLSRKIATGTFDEVEKALASAGQARVPEEFTPEQLGKMIDGLIDFAKDEVWALVNPKLTELLGKGMSLLDKLFDIPRGALVAAIGVIPFVGGVIASAINFGLGLVVDIVKGFLIGEVMNLAEFIIKDIMDGLKGAFTTKFFKNADGGKAREEPAAKLTELQRRVRAAVRRNPSFAALATSMGDAVDGVRHSLKMASRNTKETVRALVMTAMKDLLLRGVASANVREMVTAALRTIAPQFTEPGFTLAKGVGAVLSKIEGPLGQLVGDAVPDPRRRQVLRRGLAALVREAATERGATRLAKSEEGVLGRLGADLIDRVRPELVGKKVDCPHSPHVDIAAMTGPAMEALAAHVAAEVLAGKDLFAVIVERQRGVARFDREGGGGRP